MHHHGISCVISEHHPVCATLKEARRQSAEEKFTCCKSALLKEEKWHHCAEFKELHVSRKVCKQHGRQSSCMTREFQHKRKESGVGSASCVIYACLSSSFGMLRLNTHSHTHTPTPTPHYKALTCSKCVIKRTTNEWLLFQDDCSCACVLLCVNASPRART